MIICVCVSVHTVCVELVSVCGCGRAWIACWFCLLIWIHNVSYPVYTLISVALARSISFAFVLTEFHSIVQCINGIYRLLLVSVCAFKSSLCMSISIKEKKKKKKHTQQQNQFTICYSRANATILNMKWAILQNDRNTKRANENQKRLNCKSIVLFDVARVFTVVVAVIFCHITNVLLCIFDWTRSCTLFNRIDYRLKSLSVALVPITKYPPAIQSTRCRLICCFRTSITIFSVVYSLLFPELAHTKTEEKWRQKIYNK